MARLYDRLLRKGYEAGAGTALLYKAQGAFDAMEDATVVVADNVDEFVASWDWTSDAHNPVKDIPIVASPLSPAFYEAMAHGRKAKDILAYGALVTMHDLSTDEGRAILESPFYLPRAHGLRIADFPEVAPEFSGDLAGARFVTESWLFYEPRAGGLLSVPGCRPQLLGVYLQPSSADGSPMFEYEHPLRRSVVLAHAENHKAASEAMLAGVWMLLPLYLAMSFMHCKNVDQREVRPSFIESQPWRKKYGRPLVRYYVLDIDPMQKVLRDEGGISSNGPSKALHICRGHFVTYTKERPLFGRIAGTFWKPQHVRGNRKHGVVIKDYNVKAPPHA